MNTLKCILAYAIVFLTIVGGIFGLITVEATPENGIIFMESGEPHPLYLWLLDIVTACAIAVTIIGLIIAVWWAFATAFGSCRR